MDYPEYFSHSSRLVMLPPATTRSEESDLQNGGLDERVQEPLCTSCRSLKFFDLPRDRPVSEMEMRDFTGRIKLFFIPDKRCSNCAFCKILSGLLVQLSSDWVPQAFRCFRLPNGASSEEFFGNDWKGSGFKSFSITQANQSTFIGKRVFSRYDHRRAKLWIDGCLQHHERCRIEKLAVEGMRLMDCATKTIVDAQPDFRWVALSYVWGPDDTETATTPDRSHSTGASKWSFDLPRTVLDAITVTADLGFRYLWCDVYCIDQEKASHKLDQISKMDKIYQNAEFTIVATGPNKHHGLPGVSTARISKYQVFSLEQGTVAYTGPDPHRELRDSAWMTRAWTFQEGLLSRRLLVFTDHEMSFYCGTVSWTESLGGLEHIKDPGCVIWQDWQVRIAPVGHIDRTSSIIESRFSIIRRQEEFYELVKKYTHRKLGRDSDALNAFTGVVQHLSGIGSSIYHIAGLPYCLALAIGIGVNEKCLACALSWSSVYKANARRTAFPSWSWAGWTGAVHWISTWGLHLDDYNALISNVRIASEASSATSVSINSEASQEFLNTVDTILFTAPLIPVQKIFNGRPSLLMESLSWGYITSFQPPVTQVQFYENMFAGLWSCLLLGYSESIGGSQVLVVRWKDAITAERVGCLQGFDLTSADLQELERRDVILV